MKKELENAVMATSEPDLTLVVETGSSDVAIAATSSQNGGTVAFFSRTLTPVEKRHSVVKKACPIVGTLKSDVIS